jgi:glutamate-ammonia-ligase adenylyltransferase
MGCYPARLQYRRRLTHTCTMDDAQAQALQTALLAQDAVALAKHLGPLLRSPTGPRPSVEAVGALARTLLPIAQALDGRTLWRLCRDAAAAARPAISLQRLVALAARAPVPASAWHPQGRRALAAALGSSDAVARMLEADPACALALYTGQAASAAPSQVHLRAAVRHLRATATDIDTLATALRHFRGTQWLHIVARATAGIATVAQTMRALSDLADVVVDVCARYLLRRARSISGPFVTAGCGWAGFAVVAQGKLGGRELNMSSDIDLQFFYDRPEVHDAATSELQGRYTTVARRLIHALSHSDAVGMGYRVDMDLRPEGKKGPLVNAVPAAEAYYAAFGAPWERLALIRARHIGGAAWVTAGFLRSVHSFVYPRHVAEDTVAKVRSVANRIASSRRAARLRLGDAPGIDIKRDHGGIRDVELFVQTLQHLHGGQHPSLQTGSLMAALTALPLCGVLPLATCADLRQSYLFLREVENCLQAVEERQTHLLPVDKAALGQLAGSLRLRGGAKALRRQLAAARQRVRRRTQGLFAAPRARPRSRAAVALASRGADQCGALAAMGFVAPDEAQGALQSLASSRHSPFWAPDGTVGSHLAVALLAAMARSPDPDQALRLYTDLDPQLRRAPGYLRLLAAAPAVRQRLMDLLGTSALFGRTLVQFPDLIDWLGTTPDPSTSRLPRDADTYGARLQPRLARFTGDVSLQGRALCRFKMREQLRIALLDIAGALHVQQVTGQLASLAEACVRAALRLAAATLRPDAAATGSPGTDGAGPADATAPGFCVPQGFVILAVGRLGGWEMGYGSDLDLLFVYNDSFGDEADRRPMQALRLAQRCIAQLTNPGPEGALYPIDTRLRPSGNQGPLVTTAAGFIAYYRQRAMLWEHQALLRARPIAGDLALGHDVLVALAPCRYPPALAAGAWSEIHHMRQRMQAERSQARGGRTAAAAVGDTTDIKLDAGGLADLEFAVQALQLRHAHAHPSLQHTATATVLSALGGSGAAPPQLSPARCRRLLAAYWFLRRLENALRIVHDRPLSAVNFGHPANIALARRLGYAGRAQPLAELQRDWQRMAHRASRFYRDVLQPTAAKVADTGLTSPAI